MPQPPLPTPQAVDSALAAAYARPEMAPPERSPVLEWLGRAWDAVTGFVRDLFGGIPVSEQASRALFWTVLAVLGVLGLLIAVHLLAGAAGVWRTRERGVRVQAGGATALGLGAPQWDDLARKAAREGRWREAALALYQALILRLHDRGALRYDPSKTPGDYRRESRRGHAEAAAVLEPFLRQFEPVAFGNRPIDAEGYDRLRGLATRGGADA